MKSKPVKRPNKKPEAIATLKKKNLTLENKILKLENKVLKQERIILTLQAENEKIKRGDFTSPVDLSKYKNINQPSIKVTKILEDHLKPQDV